MKFRKNLASMQYVTLIESVFSGNSERLSMDNNGGADRRGTQGLGRGKVLKLPVHARQERVHGPAERDMHLAQVRYVIEERARRFEYLRADLFAEPAWDILLRLYMSELSEERVTVACLAESTYVPSSTTIRWIKMLECENLIARIIEPCQPRRVIVALTDKGSGAMAGYFSRSP
jgi:DNA-binding MarR family transcriptional regulator